MKQRRLLWLLLLLLLGLAGFLGYAWSVQRAQARRIVVGRDAIDTPRPNAPKVQSGYDPYFVRANLTIAGVGFGTNASVAPTK